MTLLTWLACAHDPAAEAWEAAFRVDEVSTLTEGCAGDPVPIEPERPWLYVAVDRGVPDIASLYWCARSDSCRAPFTTVGLTTLTPRALSGDFAQAAPTGTLCTVRWTHAEASLASDGAMELVLTDGTAGSADVPVGACTQDIANEHVGEDCTASLTVRATRVDD